MPSDHGEIYDIPFDETPESLEARSGEGFPVREAVAAELEPDWREVAGRLQADMEQFRKRQQRLAEEAAAGERERLLTGILPVADNLERALAIEDVGNIKVWKGVALVHRELIRMLRAEGIQRVEALGRPFDPELHEAVARRKGPGKPGTVIEELQAGYTLGDRLLRPARVVVAT